MDNLFVNIESDDFNNDTTVCCLIIIIKWSEESKAGFDLIRALNQTVTNNCIAVQEDCDRVR